MARKQRRNRVDDPVLQELIEIKRLLILQLLSSGLVADQIGQALNVDRSAIARMVPASAAKRRS